MLHQKGGGVPLTLYLPSVSLKDIFERSHNWYKKHIYQSENCWPRYTQNRETHARHPKIGFISADFRCHAVGFLAIPAFESLARAGVSFTCYSNATGTDDLTDRFKKAATLWRNVARLTDDELVSLIRADEVDILIDLSGYTDGHRMYALAKKPAPILIASWIGYPATTGIAAMDYYLADQYQVPQGSEIFYTEKIVRLPHSYICFSPPSYASSEDMNIDPLPPRITFGSFNAAHKITKDTIGAWAGLFSSP